jgi:hypothetical protein
MDFVATLQAAAFSEPPTRPLDLGGFVNAGFTESLARAAEACAGQPFLEVGTWRGASAVRIAEELKPSKLVCVDTWLGAPEFYTWGAGCPLRDLQKERGYPTVFRTFCDNVMRRGLQDVVAPLPMSSVQAAQVLAHHCVRFAGAYVDAAHEYEAVLADLRAFAPLVDKVMWGDDYDQHWPGVRRAVDQWAAEVGRPVEVRGNNWMVWLA